MTRRARQALVILAATAACDGITPPADAGIADACSIAADRLRDALCGEAWTVAVRVDARTAEITSYAITCGPKLATTEAGALNSVTAGDCRISQSPDPAADVITFHGPDPSDFFAFGFEPADLGGVGVVSVNSGAVAYAGTMIVNGRGEAVCPIEWRPGGELGSGCPPDRVDDVVERQIILDSTTLFVPDFEAFGTVYETGVVQALRDAGAIVGHARVFAAYDLGGGEPDELEWIVILAGEAE